MALVLGLRSYFRGSSQGASSPALNRSCRASREVSADRCHRAPTVQGARKLTESVPALNTYGKILSTWDCIPIEVAPPSVLPATIFGGGSARLLFSLAHVIVSVMLLTHQRESNCLELLPCGLRFFAANPLVERITLMKKQTTQTKWLRASC